MDELISRNEAIKWFFRPYSNEESYSNLDVERALKAIPTVDAVPVVHGMWIDEHPDNFLDPRMRCSICRAIANPLIKWHYCPNCGAKMDDEQRVMRGAAEHQEPKYQSWGEWLSEIGVFQCEDGKWRFAKANDPISADIAEKLRLQPKENN